MPTSESTSQAPVPAPRRAGRNDRPKLTDAAKLERKPPAVAPSHLGPHLYRVPVSSGVWAMSTDESPAAPLPRGLYQQERSGEDAEPRYALRSALPYVHARIIRRDGSGRRIDTDYLLSGAKDSPRVLVPSTRVRSGEWAGAVGLNQSADRKVIDAAGTAIFYMRPLSGEYAGEREAVPRIGPDGKVSVPVAEALPDGYLVTGSLSRPEALARWRLRIIPGAVANPKLALVLGSAASAPYLGALARQSHLVNMDGDSDQGKSTAMKVTAGLWGNPFVKGGLLGSWSGTRVRLPRRLGLLGILPCFLDERGMADFATPAEWGKAIYSITDGPREVAESRGSGLRLTAPWDGVLVSAGNGSLLDGLGAGPYAGVGIKRVVSLQAPFTRNADEAEAMIDALRDAYGHPGLAILERFTVPEVDKLIKAVIPLVGMPAGGNPRSLAKNLHGAVAGAAMLDLIFGTGTELRDAAATAAREYLEVNGHDPEHDADRMLALIRESMAGQPARWPTVSEYREHRLPRQVYGHDGKPEDPGRVELPQHGVDRNIAGVRADDGSWFAMIGAALDELLTRAGADRTQALTEADKRRWLHRTASDRAAGKMATVVKGVGRMYRFALPETADGEDHEPPAAPEPGPEPVSEPAPADTERCRGCGGVDHLHAWNCPELPPLPPEPDEDQDQDQDPGEFPWADPEPVPAAIVPLMATAPAAPETAPEVIDSPFALAVRAYLEDCAATPGIDRRYHPTADGACKMIAHHGRAEADAIRAAFTAAVTAAESAPEPAPAPAALEVVPGPEPIVEPEPGRAPELAEPEPDTDADELAAFGRAIRKVNADATDAGIAAGLAIFHTATDGVRWVSYPGQVGQAWFARLAARYPSMRPPVPLASPKVAEITTARPLTRINYAVKPKTAVRAGKHYFTSYDLNGQFMAAAGSAELGDGEPEVITSPREIAALTGFPGYVRLARALRTGHPAFGTLPAGEWVAMPLVRFLARDLGLTVPAAEVVYWPDHGRRMSVYVSRYRDARERLMKAEPSEGVQIALAALKSQANAFIGMFHSKTYSHGGFYRADWYDQIVATAEANALRALAKCPVAPVAKMADSAYWIADREPFEPEGLVISGQLGKWKLDRHGPVTDDLIAGLRDHAPASVRDAAIAIYAERQDAR